MIQSTLTHTSETGQWLTSEEIQQVVSGNTAYGVFATRNILFTVYLNPDGTVVGHFWDGVTSWVDRGHWRVADDMLYGKWEQLANGVEFGVRYNVVGNTCFAYQPDGQLNRIQFFGKGDPEGLASFQTIESSLPASNSPAEAQIRENLQRWRELFSQAQYSLKGYEDLYLNTNELLVYDSYTPAGYDREIRGWDQYKTLWEKYIPIDFPGWKITDLTITRLEVQGDTAWSTVSYVGQGVKDGQPYAGGQHGTHIWKQIDGEWRIVHEHLTAMSDSEVQARTQSSD
jgi:ketosteroid isomerase-like protein